MRLSGGGELSLSGLAEDVGVGRKSSRSEARDIFSPNMVNEMRIIINRYKVSPLNQPIT